MYEVNKALSKAKRDSFIYRFFGGFLQWLFLILWAISVVMLFTGDGNWIVMVVLFLLIGVFKTSYDKGIALKSLIETYGLFCNHLEGKFNTPLEELAMSLSMKPELLEDYIEKMIKLKFIVHIELTADKENRIVYIQNHGIVLPIKKAGETQTLVAVTCDACCGVTEIPEGETGVCSYCGSKIQG